MAKTKSLYEVKQEGRRKKNPNTITDSDYFLRNKEAEAEAGFPNTLDMTPKSVTVNPVEVNPVAPVTPVTKPTKSKGE